MIFSSPLFIFLFLPITFFGYFFLNKLRLTIAGKAWLVIASLFFYAYWKIEYLPLLLGSIFFNYVVGAFLIPNPKIKRPQFLRYWVLIGGITANVVLLGYYKYVNFFVNNVNIVFHASLSIPEILLPLGISFFTFTQIAYLVDSYCGKAKDYSLLNYSLFVTFFPHLIAGPILHHREMISQFESRWGLAVRYRNIFMGLFIFSLGLFKKVIIADTFAIWANAGFDGGAALDFFAAWATSLSYTFQIYFDFSGYCDMAIGASLLFNVWLPINFNSPYKALNIQDFWRRWHITLSRYLRDYIYIPLGGNRCSAWRCYLNLMVTFVLGGLWHGASWMFIIWGAMHGMALALHRVWTGLGLRMPKAIAWVVTFIFINITWVFFRAKNLDDALRILHGLIDIRSGFDLPIESIPTASIAWGGWLSDCMLMILPSGIVTNILCFGMIAIAFVIVGQKNSFDLMKAKGNCTVKLYGSLLLFCIATYSAIITKSTVFLYFNF